MRLNFIVHLHQFPLLCLYVKCLFVTCYLFSLFVVIPSKSFIYPKCQQFVLLTSKNFALTQHLIAGWLTRIEIKRRRKKRLPLTKPSRKQSARKPNKFSRATAPPVYKSTEYKTTIHQSRKNEKQGAYLLTIRSAREPVHRFSFFTVLDLTFVIGFFRPIFVCIFSFFKLLYTASLKTVRMNSLC